MYTVQPNDTPALIAAKMTGNAHRFPELIAANPHKMKMRVRGAETFTDLSVGEQLYVPQSFVAAHTGVGEGVGRGGAGGGAHHGGGGGGGNAWHRGGSGGSSHGGARGWSHSGNGAPTPGNTPPSGGGGGGGGNQSAPPPGHPPTPGGLPPAHVAPPGGGAPSPPAGPPPAHWAPPSGGSPPGPPGPPHHGHFHHDHGQGHGWGGGWWTGDWWLFYAYGVTEAQVDACSWARYCGTDEQCSKTPSSVSSKLRELQATGMKPGELQFFRFHDVSGIFQFYLAQDGRNIHVDRCDDGVVGMGQNYIWDRYPGEVDPETPAHTLSVGLSGVGVDGCCGQTAVESSAQHHPQCDWEWGTCTCEFFGWDYSIAPDRTSVYQEPNYGSDQIHLKAGVGPLGPITSTAPQGPGVTGMGQQHVRASGEMMHGFGQTTNADGTVTMGDVTYTPPTTGPSVPNWGFPAPGSTTITPAPGGGSVVTSTTIPDGQLPPANQSQPGTIPQGLTPAWPTPAPAPAASTSAPAVSSSTNTGMLVAGLAAVALGLGGIMYLAHARQVGKT